MWFLLRLVTNYLRINTVPE